MSPKYFGILFSMYFLSGCQMPVKQTVAVPGASIHSEALELDAELGERAEPNEVATDQRIATTVSDYIQRRYSEGRRPATRDAHAKAHGCVRATFAVDASLPRGLRQGVFIPGKQYAAWIRFSNGASEINPDKAQDARGMAIKLTGVDGAKILPEEKNAKTQDFILINHPVFFVDSPAQYLAMLEAFHKRIVSDQTNLLNALGAAVPLGLRGTRLALQLQAKRIASPLYERYWSMTPYQFGVGLDRQAIKFLVKPCTDGDASAPGFFSHPDANYLRQAMATTLSSNAACFNFYVQMFQDFSRTPIEQSTVEWTETAAPPVRVATITIPAQRFDSAAQMSFCENISYTPWHALPEHKPLGAVNRTRRVVYTAVSKTRHELNRATRVEPTGDEQF